MNRTLALLILPLACHLCGCAALKPGADPLVVRCQQTERVAFETFDTFLRIERSQAARIRAVAPAVSDFAGWLREPLADGPRGVSLVRSLGAVRRAYQADRSDGNRSKVESSLRIVAATLAETQKHLTAAKAIPQ